ncbi:F-box/LRR-repeat protein 4-like [Cornus florida]|uniref:F-box/LRR-repeat protein 4-like n=1 Tax=Cornus florida TaxID=4283 RepID=UPI00289F67C9|nr:F-box/LRR-repeat protein 4-like [Cornus florida]XP_059641731.1 F-box/LRR-repeat protein 4-like [Cornus florida]
MERFGDDVLGLILKWVENPNDRKSFSEVCKQWSRVEGLHRLSLRVFEPNLLPNFLPRFPNLVSLESSIVITNAHIKFIAKTCPNIEVLNLNYKETHDGFDDIPDLDDVDGYGICEIAIGCPNLAELYLRRRCQVGNFGVISLVNLARNLTSLDLGRCNRIADESLKAIGNANSLQVLNLRGCWLITDRGLAFLASGSVSRSLRKLVIAECDRITDFGVLHLREMCCLEELNVADCGAKVTDTGGVAIAAIQTLKRLNLQWLINISDATLVALAQNCLNLVAVDLTGCESVTGDGIRALANHESLESLVLASCHNLNGDDLQHMVLGCRTLRYIVLDIRLRTWIPMTMQDNISKLCQLEWK